MTLRGRKKGGSPSTERPIAVTSKSRRASSRYKRRPTEGRRRNIRKLRQDGSREVEPSGSGVKTYDMHLRAKGYHKNEIRKRSAHRNSIRRIRAATRLPAHSTTVASTTPHSKLLHACTTPHSKSLHGYNLRSSTSLHKGSNKVSVGRPTRFSPILKTKLTGKRRHRPRSAPLMRREGDKGRVGPRNIQRRGLRADIMKDLMSRLITVHSPAMSHRFQKIKPMTVKLHPRGVFNNQSESIVKVVRKLKMGLAETAPIFCVMCLRNGKIKCAEFTNNYWPDIVTSSALF